MDDDEHNKKQTKEEEQDDKHLRAEVGKVVFVKGRQDGSWVMFVVLGEYGSVQVRGRGEFFRTDEVLRSKGPGAIRRPED